MKSYLKYLFTGFMAVCTLFLLAIAGGTLFLALQGGEGEGLWLAFWFFILVLVVYLAGTFANWKGW